MAIFAAAAVALAAGLYAGFLLGFVYWGWHVTRDGLL